MKSEQIYDGPLGQYVLEIAIILLVAFILGYLLRLLLNDVLKDQLSELELENEVLKKQLTETNSATGEKADAKLRQSELKVRELNDRLSQCIATRVKAENALISAEGKLKKLEPKDLTEKTSLAEPVSAMNVASDSNSKDDLTRIEGVGPKIQQLLNDGGLKTFKDVINATPQQIRTILIAAGPTYAVHDPSTWGEQSSLAANGKWDELKQLQDELKGGRRTK